MDCRIAISAAVVDPVGRNANWSVRGGGARMAGYRNCSTIIRSSVLQYRYWPKVTMDEGGSSLWHRLYESTFPLKWNCRCGQRFIEQVSEWFAEDWGSEAEEPRG